MADNPVAAASITCRCGQAEIAFHNPAARRCLDCCCCDCFDALEWCARARAREGQKQDASGRSGRSTPPSASPPRLVYFDNDLGVVRGEAHLRLHRLRPSGLSLRCIAVCCHTPLIVTHPMYRGNAVMVMPGGGTLTYADAPLAPSVRLNARWWDDAVREGPLPPFGSAPSYAGLPLSLCWQLWRSFGEPMKNRPRRGESAEALYGRLGDVIDMGVERKELAGHVHLGNLLFRRSALCYGLAAFAVVVAAAVHANVY